MIEHLKALKASAQKLRCADSKAKNSVLETAAALLKAKMSLLLEANAKDLSSLSSEATNAFKDRLMLNEKRIDGIVESLKAVAALPDPVDEEVDRRTLKNGLLARRVRAPLGVILMVFESRPNVAVESFSLAFKAGNAIILRGGKESMRTTGAIYDLLGEALVKHGFPRDSFIGITDPDRSITENLLKQNQLIDVVVPRGGDKLIEFVVKNTSIPVIKNDRGLCHIYVHEDADLEMAARIAMNAKTQRPGVCNAMETLLVHENIANSFLPALHGRMAQLGVEWLGCAKTLSVLDGASKVKAATPESYDTEHLELRMNARVVRSLDEAVSHIETHGSRHSEAIVTKSERAAREFQARVDAAAVYWNASTRFTDGFELGLGGELGISTQKLHVRGPVGLRELTSARWIIDGNGQVRE